PRYEIHSVGMTDSIDTSDPAMAAQRERSARALFAATELVERNRLDTNFGRSLAMTRYSEYASRYSATFTAQMRRLSEALNRAAAGKAGANLRDLVAKMASADGSEFLDPWGSRLKLAATWSDAGKTYYGISSPGADKLFGSYDDLTLVLEV